MMRAFYVFPCAHKFHADCLLTEWLPHQPASVRARATELQRRISAQSDTGQRADVTPGSTSSSAVPMNSLKQQLDELVAAECLFCGDIMIRMIDKPFISDDQYESVVQSWL